MGDINAKSVEDLKGGPIKDERLGTDIVQPEFHATYNLRTYPDADLTLISKDSTRFSVHRTVLRLSSSFFRDSLSQNQNEGASPTEPTISLGEGSDVVSVLLDILYPDKPLPDIPRITLFYDIAVALSKYNMKGALQKLSKYVMLLKNQYPKSYLPIPLYSIARRFQWSEVQQAASESSLSTSIITAASLKSLGETVRCIDTHSLIVFQDWHERRKEIVLDATGDLGLKVDPSSFTFTTTSTCHTHFSWTNLHVTGTVASTLARPKCAVDSDINGQRHAWKNALEQFQFRLRNAMDQRADCDLVLNDSFWDKDPWEFSTFECSACRFDIMDKSQLRMALWSLVRKLPKHPDDKSGPVKTPRAAPTNPSGSLLGVPPSTTAPALFAASSSAT